MGVGVGVGIGVAVAVAVAVAVVVVVVLEIVIDAGCRKEPFCSLEDSCQNSYLWFVGTGGMVATVVIIPIPPFPTNQRSEYPRPQVASQCRPHPSYR